MNTSAPERRLPSLTGLRFFAAFSVFLSHIYYTFWFTEESSATATRASVVAGSAGVAFFFVLSGFVLTWSSRTGSPAPDFWRRRAVKVYPNHLVTWALALLLIYWMGGTATSGQAIPSFFLVHAWLPAFDVHNSVNGVSWSLSCEVVFYLCFPFLIPAIRKLSSRRLSLWAGANTAAVLSVPVAATYLVSNSPHFADLGIGQHQLWLAYIFPGSRLLEFTLGMLLARMVSEGQLRFIRPWHALLAVCVAAWTSLRIELLFTFTAVFVIPFAMTVVAFAYSDIQRRRTVLRTPVLVWLGEVSFAFYLTHGLVMSVAEHVYGDHFATAAMLAKLLWSMGLFLAATACSWMLYVLVERPLMRRFGTRRRENEAIVESDGAHRPGAGADART
ncbi:acyltransferase family protein [Streptomyces massasporeus]|uniref:Acyltransferase family protein n=1 Tax=Streptomyces massasporeus TaxID=67324 RepID=A0ABW6LT80_9ACTN